MNCDLITLEDQQFDAFDEIRSFCPFDKICHQQTSDALTAPVLVYRHTYCDRMTDGLSIVSASTIKCSYDFSILFCYQKNRIF